MKILRIDWNNTLQDQIGQIISATLIKYGRLTQREAFDQWDPPIGTLIGVDNAEWTQWAWSDPLIKERALPFVYCRAEMLKLSRMYQIIITTADPDLDRVAHWLERFTIAYSSIEHALDKSVFPDWLLDDSPLTLPAAQKPIRFFLPWNRGLSHLPTVWGWYDAARKIQAVIG